MSESRIEVQIGKETHIVTSDNKNWIVSKAAIDKNGKPTLKHHSFYSSVDGLIKGLFEYKLKASDYNSLTDLMMNVRKICDELSGMFDITVTTKGEK